MYGVCFLLVLIVCVGNWLDLWFDDVYVCCGYGWVKVYWGCGGLCLLVLCVFSGYVVLLDCVGYF